MGEQNSGYALNIHSRVLLVGLSNSLKISNDVLLHGLSLTELYNAGSRLLQLEILPQEDRVWANSDLLRLQVDSHQGQ